MASHQHDTDGSWRCTRTPGEELGLQLDHERSSIVLDGARRPTSTHGVLEWMGGRATSITCDPIEATGSRRAPGPSRAVDIIGNVVMAGWCLSLMTLLALAGAWAIAHLADQPMASEHALMATGLSAVGVLSASSLATPVVSWLMARDEERIAQLTKATERSTTDDLDHTDLLPEASELATALLRRWRDVPGHGPSGEQVLAEIATAQRAAELAHRVLDDEDASQAEEQRARAGLEALGERTAQVVAEHEEHHRTEQLVAAERERVLEQFARADRERERALALDELERETAQLAPRPGA